MKRTVAIEIISFMYIILFMYAAFTKLLDYEKFSVQLSLSPMLMAFSDWVAWSVPTLELLIAVGLMTFRFRLVALYASFTLMVIFTSYIIAILGFADYVPCSCGGILEKMGWTAHLIFNIAFVLLAMVAIVLKDKEVEQAHTPALAS